MLYGRKASSVGDLVFDYDRAWAQLRAETIEQRRALLDLQERFEATVDKSNSAAIEAVEAENEQLRREVLWLRDLVIGHSAELATALGRQAELEALVQSYEQLHQQLQNMRQRHAAVLGSRSWRLMWLLGTPVRALKSRQL